MSFCFRSLMVLVLLLGSQSIWAKGELNVYTYSSFTSDWGPAGGLKKLFEQKCSCLVKFVAVGDGGTLISRLKLEGKSSRADLLLGIDNLTIQEAIESDLFLSIPSSKVKLQVKIPDSIKTKAVPFNFGLITIMYDSTKLAVPPKSLDDLLDRPDFKKKLILQDPRFSTPGLNFLLSLSSKYTTSLPSKLKSLRRQTLAVTPGWSEAYALFTKGEAPMVVSYTTSEFYHRVVDKTTRYKAAIFPRHEVNVEFGGIVKASKNKALAATFLDFLLTPEAQKIVAEANWMYPVIPDNEIKDLNPIFSSMKKPPFGEIQFLTPKERGALKDTWLREFK